MVQLQARFDLASFRRTLNDQQKKLLPRATRIALNRVATTVRKEASISIRDRLAISAAVAKKALTIKKLDGGQTILIVASGKPIPLRDYGAKPTKRGVSYKVSKARGRRLYTNKYGSAFQVQSIAGNVFIRTTVDPPGKAKARITKVYGPSVPQYFVTRIIRQVMLTTAKQRWPIEFQRAWAAVSSGR